MRLRRRGMARQGLQVTDAPIGVCAFRGAILLIIGHHHPVLLDFGGQQQCIGALW